MPTDPVCGKELGDDEVAALGSYEGVTYAFFAAVPGSYVVRYGPVAP